MKNIEEESAEFKFEDITKKVEKYLNKLDEEHKKLDAQISKYKKAILDAGFSIAKIHYRKKDWYDEYGQERWFKYEHRINT